MPKKNRPTKRGKSSPPKTEARYVKKPKPKKPSGKINSIKIVRPDGSGTLKEREKHFKPPRDEHNKFLFLEEFVHIEDETVKPTVPRELRAGTPVLADFVGVPFNHAADGYPGFHFDRYLRLLMDVIRGYNRALYRLRRAHFIEDFHNVPQSTTTRMDELPNEHRDYRVPPVGSSNFKDQFEKIEDAFHDASRELDRFLSLPQEFNDPFFPDYALHVDGMVDCIRVNDYIVSVHVAAYAGTQRLIRDMKEIPFSSSSHTSISSPFSSYSSGNGWQSVP